MSEKEKNHFFTGHATGLFIGFAITNWIICPKLLGCTLLRALIELIQQYPR